MKIVVLYGGTSAERDVSIASGKAIAKGLRKYGHEVNLIDTALNSKQLEDISKEKITTDIVKSQPPTFNKLDSYSSTAVIESTTSQKYFSGIDVAFIALHGGFGEDGTIQGLLELAGIPYTGSGVLASAVAMDKAMSKKLFETTGVLTPSWILVEMDESSPFEKIKNIVNQKLQYPVVVKPNNQGSTVGLTVVKNLSGLENAISNASKFDSTVLIEEYIKGRELTVAILGDKSLPVVEIHPEHDIYDYECKYTKGMSNYSVPAKISKEVTEDLKNQALKAFNVLKCEGYARVDFRLDGKNKAYCLEVNTLPGMTDTSLVPKAAGAAGIEFPELVDMISTSALTKKRRTG